MTRFAARRRVFYVEEPLFDSAGSELRVSRADDVHVVVPHLKPGIDGFTAIEAQRALLGKLFEQENITQPLFWFYTPMALPIAEPWVASSAAVVYDCMDELSGFHGAPPEMRAAELELLAAADVVFTGGPSLYEAKRSLHPNVHAFPSSVDAKHFGGAASANRPDDQRRIPRPRVGFCGVIDERMDLTLVREVACAMPHVQFVMIGPVAKIDPASLPALPNIHYLGARPYSELPGYMGGWDAAILPFAHNAATRFISPTKTPEYLAAGVPVVSTSIADVVRPYGINGFVEIADSPAAFCNAIARSMTPYGSESVARARAWIRTQSWDRTLRDMQSLVNQAVVRRRTPARATRPTAGIEHAVST